MEQFYIDPEAKSKIELTKILDANDCPYYIGKLQFPGTLEFTHGASFFVFVSESGVEELQIAPLNPARINRKALDTLKDGTYIKNDKGSFRVSIDLNPMVDQNGNTYYVGEAIGLKDLNLRDGIFFTIFISKSGEEELQITKLNHKRRRRYIKNNPRVEFRKSYFNSDNHIDSSPP